MKKIRNLPSLSRVTAGSKATLELPLGETYERLIFDVTATSGLSAASIGRIDLLIDGNVVQTYKNLQRLIDLNAYYKRDADVVTGTAMQFAIHLNRAELLDSVWRKAPGIGTADIQTLHLEIEIASDAPETISIDAHAQVDPIRQNLGAFFKVKEFPISSANAGELQIDKLPRGAWYGGIHLFKSDVNDVEVVADDVKMIDATKGVLERLQKGASPVQRVPQTAKATHIDFMLDGSLLDCLPTANLQDFRINATLGTSGAIDVVTETVDTIQS